MEKNSFVYFLKFTLFLMKNNNFFKARLYMYNIYKLKGEVITRHQVSIEMGLSL